MLRTLLAIPLCAGSLLAQVSPAPTSILETRGVRDFVINNEEAPKSLDPAQMSGTPEYRLYLALYEGLVVPDAKGCGVEPGLAESWSASEDRKTYTFQLRKTHWSDGSPIQAQDVVDSWLRELAPETRAKNTRDMVEYVEGARDYHTGKGPADKVGIRALDPATFQVTFTKPMPRALFMLTKPGFAVVPLKIVRQFGKDWAKPEHFVGNGPFVLTAWDSEGNVVAEKSSGYWDAAHVGLERITFQAIPDENFALEEFQAGRLDWSPVIDPIRYPELRSRPDFQASPAAVTSYLMFNLNRKPFKDVRVRKALSLAIDRRALCEQVSGTGQLPACGIVPPLGGYPSSFGEGFDPERARQLLSEAGYPGGKGFPKIEILYNTLASHERMTEWILAQWKSVLGIEGRLDNQDWQAYQGRRSRHEFDICRVGFRVSSADPMAFLDTLKSGSTDNAGSYTSKPFDDLLSQADALPEGSERDRLLKESEELAIAQDQAVMPLFHYPNQDLIDLAAWKGWSCNPLGIHPWKHLAPAREGARPTPGAVPAALPGPDGFQRDVHHLYQLDSRIGTGATGLCGPTSSAMAIATLSAKFPRLAPEGMTGFDLIRTFAEEEGAGKTTGVTDFAIEARLERYIKKAGYKPTIRTLGISVHDTIAFNRAYEFTEVQEGLKDPDTMVLVIIGYYDYDQRRGDYVRDGGHVMVLAGYDGDGLLFADPAMMCGRSYFRRVPVAHPGASLMSSSKTWALARTSKGFFELVRDPWSHAIIETVMLVHVAES